MKPRWLRFPGLLLLLACAVLSFVRRHARADAPAGRYTFPASGRVFDTKTGLTWQQTPSASPMSLANAITYCSSAGAGWRLPTVKELVTLVDMSQAEGTPMIDANAFPSSTSTYFWSGTYAGASSTGYYVGFGLPDGALVFADSGDSNSVRCVR